MLVYVRDLNTTDKPFEGYIGQNIKTPKANSYWCHKHFENKICKRLCNIFKKNLIFWFHRLGLPFWLRLFHTFHNLKDGFRDESRTWISNLRQPNTFLKHRKYVICNFCVCGRFRKEQLVFSLCLFVLFCCRWIEYLNGRNGIVSESFAYW